MKQLCNDDLRNQFESLPDEKLAVTQLFESGYKASQQRFYITIIDIERTEHKGISYLAPDYFRGRIIQEFAEFFSQIISFPLEVPNKETKIFIRHLHMLLYSQFWECIGIQRLLTHLVDIVDNKKYKPRLLLDDKDYSTYKRYKHMRKQARKNNLIIADILDVIYKNQIRNAFAHSEISIHDDWIIFHNYDYKHNNIPSMKIETWEILFQHFKKLVIEIFTMRFSAEQELKDKLPYPIRLPEFKIDFQLMKDRRGSWSTQPIT